MERKRNPLVGDLLKVMKKWHKRWPNIAQPWPLEGTFNPEVIETMRGLVAAYKVNESRGGKGVKRQEKTEIELGVLQLFDDERECWLKSVKDQGVKCAENIQKAAKREDKLKELETPFSHVAPGQRPPPYEGRVYPQLPLINQEDDYLI